MVRYHGSEFDKVVTSRKFGKHLFHPIRLYRLKTQAKEGATKYRKKGYLARMVKVGGVTHTMWAVYIWKEY
jgi:hypothetical protein